VRAYADPAQGICAKRRQTSEAPQTQRERRRVARSLDRSLTLGILREAAPDVCSATECTGRVAALTVANGRVQLRRELLLRDHAHS